jgi:hypothetical protein
MTPTSFSCVVDAEAVRNALIIGTKRRRHFDAEVGAEWN